MKINEFYVPVPWGQVAVKAWGNSEDPKILTVHGVEDNAASFDRLIPQLPSSFYYLCIDLPGHGKSSHFPAHCPLHLLNFVLTLRVVTNYLKWERYTILSHSIGSMTSMLFTMLYPDKVEKLINIDGLVYYPVKPQNMVKYIRSKFEDLLKYEETSDNMQGLSYQEILDDFVKKRENFPIQKDAAEILLTRCLVEVAENQYRLSTDDRLGICILRPLYDLPYLIKSYQQRPLTCPVLIILADKNKYQQKFFERFINVLKKQKNIQIVKVNEEHLVHMHNPEKISPIINRFMASSNKSKL